MTSTPNTGYLIEDQWDDWFQYSTMYDLYIVDSLSHQCYMGKTKIGQKGMVEDQRRPALPESFSRLSEDFFSLGQDSYYYENIKNLGDVMRSEILAALNDIAYNTKLIRTAQKEPVTKKSLLRSVPLTTVKEQFNRIALGGARLTPYNFEYRSVPIREGIEPITIEFNVDPDSYPPSNIHVIIGRNGVGKTYLISNMIRSIIQPRNNLRENVGETRFLHDKQTAVDHFSRIVFVSFSAFDELNFKTKSEKFVRIGLPAHSGENTHEHLNKIFAASFSACLHGPQRMLLTKVLHMLTSDPMFSESEIVTYCEEDSQYDSDTLISVFSRLSSGHKIILLSITQLVEKVMEILKRANSSLMYSVPVCVKQSRVIILLLLSNEQRPSNAPITNACLILLPAGLISCFTKSNNSSNVKYCSVEKEKANPLLLPGSTARYAGCGFNRGFPLSFFTIFSRIFLC